jgi:hypothetical protein
MTLKQVDALLKSKKPHDDACERNKLGRFDPSCQRCATFLRRNEIVVG